MTREATAARPGRASTAPPAPRGDEAAAMAHLLCRAGTILCALPIDHVIEIMRVLPLEPFAAAPRFVRGVSVIRGVPVPVVDVGLLVGGESTALSRFVTVRVGARAVALAVGEVVGISQGIDAGQFGRLPPLLHDAAADTIEAIGASDRELLVLLRTGRLLPEDVLAGVEVEGAPT